MPHDRTAAAPLILQCGLTILPVLAHPFTHDAFIDAVCLSHHYLFTTSVNIDVVFVNDKSIPMLDRQQLLWLEEREKEEVPYDTEF